MSLLSLIVVLIVIGIILYVINQFVPMDAQVKKILNVVVVLFLCLWLLEAFGLLDFIRAVRIGKP